MASGYTLSLSGVKCDVKSVQDARLKHRCAPCTGCTYGAWVDGHRPVRGAPTGVAPAVSAMSHNKCSHMCLVPNSTRLSPTRTVGCLVSTAVIWMNMWDLRPTDVRQDARVRSRIRVAVLGAQAAQECLLNFESPRFS
jgi:hypothetical protein